MNPYLRHITKAAGQTGPQNYALGVGPGEPGATPRLDRGPTVMGGQGPTLDAPWYTEYAGLRQTGLPAQRFAEQAPQDSTWTPPGGTVPWSTGTKVMVAAGVAVGVVLIAKLLAK